MEAKSAFERLLSSPSFQVVQPSWASEDLESDPFLDIDEGEEAEDAEVIRTG